MKKLILLALVSLSVSSVFALEKDTENCAHINAGEDKTVSVGTSSSSSDSSSATQSTKTK